MKSLEITLKLCFLILAVALLWTKNVIGFGLWSFLLVSITLGVVLIINKKHPSYTYPKNYKRNDRVLMMRRLEGILLVLFALGGFTALNFI
jgi:hypothetical protein